MQSFMELIFIDPADDNARQTNMRRAAATNAETWREFCGYRKHAVDIKTATFLLDYHNKKGMVDTIALDNAGFRAITGQVPKPASAYRKIDTDHWKAARKAA